MKKYQPCFEACMESWMRSENCIIDLSIATTRRFERCLDVCREAAEMSLWMMRLLARESDLTQKAALLLIGVYEECAELCEQHMHRIACRKCAEACRNSSNLLADFLLVKQNISLQ